MAQQLRAQGLKLREIAAVMGYKVATVHAWLSDPDRSKEVARKRSYAGTCIDCGGSTSGTANGLDRIPERCAPCSLKRDKECIVCRIHKGDHSRGIYRWSDEQIFAAIRQCVGDDGRATFGRYKRLHETSPKGSLPSPPLILRRFNSWQDACQAAGVECGRAHRIYTRTTADDCLTAVVYVAQEMGRLPTVNEYDARARDLGLPSVSNVRNRVGSWGAVMRHLHVEQKAAA